MKESNDIIEKSEEVSLTSRLIHPEYFCQFEEEVEARFRWNDSELVRYRTCQEFPCTEDDNLPNMFRKKNGQEPTIPKYSAEELEEMDENLKYSLVTKAALSFNDTPEAARDSAKYQDKKISKAKQGAKKSLVYRRNRGMKIGKFIFPEGTVIVSEIKDGHQNMLPQNFVDIGKYRDSSFEEYVNYDD